jgi:Domain of unknown function (DUF4251)
MTLLLHKYNNIMKNIKAFLFLFIILAASSIVNAQEKKPDEIKRIVESKNYVFVARMANLQVGSSRQLTLDYDLTIAKDTIISYLPYFGRAYAAPVNPSEGGIKFTSTKFDYKPEYDDKQWKITIKPKDASEVQQLYLDIFDNGSASLQVISTNRQNISFEGYIKEGKPRNKKAF